MQRKRMLLVMMALFAAVVCSACSENANVKTTDKMPVILNQAEYVLYQNIFYNEYASQYEGKSVQKQGVFAVIQDAFNDRTRYYVWGFMDNTKCCDWQWEIVPKDEKSLPPAGSLVSVKGVFAAGEEALDGYWIKDASIETVTQYTGSATEINMYAMSCTLERVQMLNILYHPEAFEGKQFFAYGRIIAPYQLQDPYYNGSWQIDFTSDSESPAIGSSVILRGKVGSGKLVDCSIAPME